MTTPTSVRLTPSERAALDDYANRVDRDRSYVVRQAVNEFLAQRASTTGSSRLADLEALAARNLSNNAGATMPTPDFAPRPVSVGSEPDTPSFGGRATVDEKVIAQNAGRQTPISKAAHDANKQHLADHLTCKAWGGK